MNIRHEYLYKGVGFMRFIEQVNYQRLFGFLDSTVFYYTHGKPVVIDSTVAIFKVKLKPIKPC